MASLVDEVDMTGVAGLSLLRKCREYGKGGELTGADRDSQEISMLALHLLQSALVHLNTLLLQRVVVHPKWQARLTTDDRRALSPLFWAHVNLYGRFSIDMNTHLDLRPPDGAFAAMMGVLPCGWP